MRQSGKKVVAILLISLILANHYVEYGRRVKASETEKSFGEYETEYFPEGGMEDETESERESETESEYETEHEASGEVGIENENRTEEENSEALNETDCEADGENENAVLTEGVAGTESTADSEAETAGIPEDEEETGEEITADSGTETEGIPEGEGETGEEITAESEAETAGIPEGEGETGEEITAESEVETAGIPEDEEETGEEYTAESEMETETAGIPEGEGETGEEYIAESEMETETESTTEGEWETEWEQITENITEIETEQQPELLQIRNIRVKEPEGGRIYDGTAGIELSYDIEGGTEELWKLVEYEAHLSGTDVGSWEVNYRFWFSRTESVSCLLEVEEVSLYAEILPRTLEVQIPDGWRSYGSKVSAEEIHLLGNVQVTGFLKDKEGEEQIPEDFELPQVDVDRVAVRQWDPIYENGDQKLYQNALILKRTEEGEITGNPSGNYRFPSETEGDKYRKGSLIVTQSQIRRGRDYEITGEDGSFFYTEDGTLWVKSGTGLSAYPLEGSGYNQGANSGALTRDGIFSFSLKQKDEQGKLTADSLEAQIGYRVDGSVPEAELNIQADRLEGGVYYGQKQAIVSVSIPADEESGISSAEYFIASSQTSIGSDTPEDGGWQDCTRGAQLELEKEGTYVIYVRTRDRAGNQAYVKSEQLVIDSAAPQLVIEGVKENSANSGSVQLKISCSDPYYKKETLQVQITGANGGKAPVMIGGEEGTESAWVEFADFGREKSADDLYTLNARAEDLAGNRTEKEIHFSINRFGSVYGLGEETEKILSGFYHQNAFPVVFLETNIDYVGKVQILCRKDGSVFTLEKGKDYSAVLDRSENGWKQYQYTIPAKTFSEEGTYEVILMSEDRASNSSDSQTQEISVRFCIDHTPPECMVTGISKNEIYWTQEVWACVEPRDNGQIKELKIYLDGKENRAYRADQIEAQGGLLKWKAVSENNWQRLQVYTSDEAGNEYWTDEIPFYVAGQSDAESIPPYENTEKSAKTLVEEERKEEQEKGNKENGVNGENCREENENLPAGVEKNQKLSIQGIAALAGKELPLRKLFFGGCILAAALLLLFAGVDCFRRKG